MKPLRYSVALLFFAAFFSHVAAQNSGRIALIPQPSQVTEHPGVFRITKSTKVQSDPAFSEVATLFSKQADIEAIALKPATNSPSLISFVRAG